MFHTRRYTYTSLRTTLQRTHTPSTIITAIQASASICTDTCVYTSTSSGQFRDNKILAFFNTRKYTSTSLLSELLYAHTLPVHSRLASTQKFLHDHYSVCMREEIHTKTRRISQTSTLNVTHLSTDAKKETVPMIHACRSLHECTNSHNTRTRTLARTHASTHALTQTFERFHTLNNLSRLMPHLNMLQRSKHYEWFICVLTCARTSSEMHARKRTHMHARTRKHILLDTHHLRLSSRNGRLEQMLQNIPEHPSKSEAPSHPQNGPSSRRCQEKWDTSRFAACPCSQLFVSEQKSEYD